MYFHCLFFHVILTVAQNTQRANVTIIPECYNVSLVVFSSVPSLGVFWEPQGNNTESIYLIQLFIPKFLLWSKLYSGNEYTDIV